MKLLTRGSKMAILSRPACNVIRKPSITRGSSDHWETDHCATHFLKAFFTLLNKFSMNYFAQNR